MIWERQREATKEESVNSSEENLNIVCMSNEPSGNKAMLGHVAPNLNLSVSESTLSFVNHPKLICLQEGLSSAAPVKETLTPGPKICRSVPESRKKWQYQQALRKSFSCKPSFRKPISRATDKCVSC